jgi:hypothetical protein
MLEWCKSRPYLVAHQAAINLGEGEVHLWLRSSSCFDRVPESLKLAITFSRISRSTRMSWNPALAGPSYPILSRRTFEGSTLPNEEAQLGAGMDDLRGGSSVLRFSGGTPPRRRGDVRRVWLSPRYRRLCDLPPAGELGAASPDCVPATAVLGILGLLGPGVGAVLAVTRASDPAPSLNRTSSSPLPTAGRRGHSGSG